MQLCVPQPARLPCSLPCLAVPLTPSVCRQTRSHEPSSPSDSSTPRTPDSPDSSSGALARAATELSVAASAPSDSLDAPPVELANFKLGGVDGLNDLTCVGVGAQGSVWVARGDWTNQIHAIKVIRTGLREMRDATMEWRAGHALQDCPQILAPLDRPVCIGEIIVLAFPWADGGDLVHAINGTRAAIKGGKPASSTWAGRQDNVRQAAIDLVDCLAYAHDRGWYHRDVKPDNVLVNDGRVCLADWGMATNDPSDRCHPGTRRYAAPEVLYTRRAPYDLVAADVWSLGVTLLALANMGDCWAEPSSTDRCYRAWLDDQEAFVASRGIAKEVLPILRGMLHPVPSRRWSLKRLGQAVRGVERWRKE